MYLSAGHIDITPVKPVPLFGFATRKGAYSKVHDQLEVNLTVLKQDGHIVLLYAVDTLFVPVSIEDEVLERFGEKYGITRANVWLMASHTHTAPSLDKTKPGLGAFDEEYYKLVVSKILTLTEQVLNSEYEEVSIEYGITKSSLNVNRRKKLWRPGGKFGLQRKTLIYPDHDGDKEDTIHLIRFIAKGGKVKSIFWNYACHPVGFTNRTEVSADFIGFVRAAIREQTNDKLPVTFAIGFAGDLKPDVTAVTDTKWLDLLGYFFQYKPKYTKFPSLSYYKQWVSKLIKEVDSVSPSVLQNAEAKLITSHTAISLNEVIGATDRQLHFKKLSIGDALHFVGISAEVLVGYRGGVKEVMGCDTINIGCMAGTDIYLPTDENINEGGYEVEIFKEMFGVEGKFEKNIDEVVRKALSSL